MQVDPRVPTHINTKECRIGTARRHQRDMAVHSALVVACCKSNDETTKARRYRFLKQSEERKFTYYLELKKTQ